jgi:hypothetical protein
MEYNNILYERYQKDNTSQSGEDGVIEEIFNRLNIKKGVAVDIGAADGKWYSNTYSLVLNNWEVFEIESSENEGLKLLSKEYPNFRHLFCHVTDDDTNNNVNKVLKEMNVPKEFDFLSIDIDSIEYWILNILEYSPKVICVEINPRIYPLDMIYHIRDENLSKEEKCILNPPQNVTGFGPIYSVCKERGYHLIGCSNLNLFFLRNDLIKEFNSPEITEVDELSNFKPNSLNPNDKNKWRNFKNE